MSSPGYLIPVPSSLFRCRVSTAHIRKSPPESGRDFEVNAVDLSGKGAARAEDAQGTPTQSHITPSILVYEDKTWQGVPFSRMCWDCSGGRPFTRFKTFTPTLKRFKTFQPILFTV